MGGFLLGVGAAGAAPSGGAVREGRREGGAAGGAEWAVVIWVQTIVVPETAKHMCEPHAYTHTRVIHA